MPASAAGTTNSFRWFADAWRGAVARARKALARADHYDLAAVLLLGALLLLVAFTFRDYAISNDEEVQQRYAELIIAYYRSGFVGTGGIVSFQEPVSLWRPFRPRGDRPAKAYPSLFLRRPASPFGADRRWWDRRGLGDRSRDRRAACGAAGCGGDRALRYLVRRDVQSYQGHPFRRCHDGRDIFPRAHRTGIAAAALAPGRIVRRALRLRAGIRALGVFLIAYALFVVAVYAPIGWRTSWRAVLAFAACSAPPLTAAFLLAYVIMIATWPWATLAPLNPLRAIFEFTDFHYKIQTVLDGRVYYMSDVPRSYVPTDIAIKLTLALLVGAGLSLVFVVLPQGAAQTANARRPANNTWRRETALIAFAAFFPLICDVIMRGPAFSGMRHFLFTVPPIAVLAGLGIDGMLSRLSVRGPLAAAFGLALVLLDLGWNATTLYRLHPDEYLFFNPLVGGLAGATGRYDTDYWVNIMPEAVGDLEHFLDRTEGPFGKSGPRRHYLVAVCGEQLPFEKEADARLAWTRDLRHAEFFIAPTHMNCDRALDGKIVASIERMGVVIGVVKDRRALIRSVAGLN